MFSLLSLGSQSVAASQLELDQKAIAQVVMFMQTVSSQAGLKQPVKFFCVIFPDKTFKMDIGQLFPVCGLSWTNWLFGVSFPNCQLFLSFLSWGGNLSEALATDAFQQDVIVKLYFAV